MVDVIKLSQNDKAPGHDRITLEMIKNMGPDGIKLYGKCATKLGRSRKYLKIILE